MHSVVLDTDQVPEPDRRDFVRNVLSATMVPVDLHWLASRAEVTARGVVTNLGDLTICSAQTTAWKVERTSKLVRDSFEPSVLLSVQRTGATVVMQHGREVVGRPGDLVMHDATSPFTLVNKTGIAGDFFRIPHSALALPPDMITDACAVRLSPEHPITKLANRHLLGLAADPAIRAARSADLIGRPTIELIRAVISAHLQTASPAAGPPESTLQVRVLEYAKARLHDPALSVEKIATANYVSVRHLYKVLSRDGISLSEWIRSRRLEACRYALAQVPQTHTISAIARSNGFSDMSTFSRWFRAAYGMSPSEWRDRSGERP